jgi:hypothetical protein
MAAWITALTVISQNQKYLTSGANLIIACIKAAQDIQAHNPGDALKIIEKEAPDAIMLLEAIAMIMFPAETILIQAVVVVAELLVVGAQMTPQQTTNLLQTVQEPHLITVDAQKEWYDRQNAT